MKEKTKQIKVSELKINEALTELRPINIFTVNKYQQNYRSGAEFPPVIVDSKTKLIVSGNHRATALTNEFGSDHEIAVIYRTYESERELVEDFAKENISHGNPLTSISKKLIMCRLLDLGASTQEIASMFDIPIKRVEKQGEGFKVVTGGKAGFKTKRKILPVKRGPVIESETITNEQYQEHVNSDLGVTFDKMALQIIRWCENGWIEKTPENLELCKGLIGQLEGLIKKIELTG